MNSTDSPGIFSVTHMETHHPENAGDPNTRAVLCGTAVVFIHLVTARRTDRLPLKRLALVWLQVLRP